MKKKGTTDVYGIPVREVEETERTRYLMSLPVESENGNPKSRNDEGIVSQQVQDEFVVYDLLRHKAHSLNSSAAFVWKQCDGRTSFETIAERLAERLEISQHEATQVLHLALEQLAESNLMQTIVRNKLDRQAISRRRIIKVIGAASVPVVLTLLTPTPAAADSHPFDLVPEDPFEWK